MSEHEEQVGLFAWAALQSGRYPELDLMFAVPNGAGFRHIGKGKKRWSPEAVRLKAEGLRPGVPDICLPVARGGFFGLFVELKFGSNTPEPSQVKMLDGLSREGYLALVCWGAEAAQREILEYLRLPPTVVWKGN